MLLNRRQLIMFQTRYKSLLLIQEYLRGAINVLLHYHTFMDELVSFQPGSVWDKSSVVMGSLTHAQRDFVFNYKAVVQSMCKCSGRGSCFHQRK
jgi:hypothetical protein